MISILLDVDTGIDDALALAYLLSRPEVRLAAITCTAGNAGARQVALNNLALCCRRQPGRCRRGTPPMSGARRPGHARGSWWAW